MAPAAVPVPHETMIINVSLSRAYYIVNQITQPTRQAYVEIHKGGCVLFNKRNNMMRTFHSY